MTRKLLSLAACIVLFATTCPVVDAGLVLGMEVGLTAVSSGGNGALNGSSIGLTLNDGFSYDPLDPEGAPLPNQVVGNSGNRNGFHGQGAGDSILTYSLTQTIVAGQERFVVDLYGRDRLDDRDNDIQIELFDTSMNLVAVVGQTPGTFGLTDTTPSGTKNYNRADFGDLAVGTTLGSLVVTGRDSDGNLSDNNFTLMEIRAAVGAVAVPEPSTALMVGLPLLGLIGQRRRR